MIMMYNEIQPWIDDYQVFVWVLVGLHHNFVILQLKKKKTWILKVFNKNTISALVCLPVAWFVLAHPQTSTGLSSFFIGRPSSNLGIGTWSMEPLLFICGSPKEGQTELANLEGDWKNMLSFFSPPALVCRINKKTNEAFCFAGRPLDQLSGVVVEYLHPNCWLEVLVPSRVIPKTAKMVPVVSLLGAQYSGLDHPMTGGRGTATAHYALWWLAQIRRANFASFRMWQSLGL